MKRFKQSKSKKSGKCFGILTMTSSICFSLYALSCVFSSPFYIHIARQEDIAPSPDFNYETDLNECNFSIGNDKFNFYTISRKIVAPINFLFQILSFNLILIAYFYRLIIIFGGSMYEISKCKINTFIILMVIFIIIGIAQIYFAVIWATGILLTMRSLFLLFSFIISFYLVCNLKKQGRQLRNQAIATNLNVNNTINNNNKMSAKGRQIVQMFARLVLLAYVCIFSTLLVVVIGIVLYSILANTTNPKYGYIRDLIFWNLVFIDIIINNICIALQYPGNRGFDIIYKYTCKPCEKRLKLMNPN